MTRRANFTTTSASICERFTSIQGEGALSGTPSFFIRFSGCNLRCRWCDTAYASWVPESENRLLCDLVDEAVASDSKHIVITGGEPMLFDQVEPLTMALREKGLLITIETAGTVHRSPDWMVCDLLSLSPKLANSTPFESDAGPASWTVSTFDGDGGEIFEEGDFIETDFFGRRRDGRRGYYVGAAGVILEADFNSNTAFDLDDQSGVINVLTNQDFDYDQTGSPRVWVGWQDEWGLGYRVTYFEFNDSAKRSARL